MDPVMLLMAMIALALGRKRTSSSSSSGKPSGGAVLSQLPSGGRWRRLSGALSAQPGRLYCGRATLTGAESWLGGLGDVRAKLLELVRWKGLNVWDDASQVPSSLPLDRSAAGENFYVLGIPSQATAPRALPPQVSELWIWEE